MPENICEYFSLPWTLSMFIVEDPILHFFGVELFETTTYLELKLNDIGNRLEQVAFKIQRLFHCKGWQV